MKMNKINPACTGLMRLVITSNKFSYDAEINLNKLYEILKTRDPQVKAASSFLNPDPDTVSVQSGKESSLGRTTTKSSKHFHFIFVGLFQNFKYLFIIS